MPPTKSDPIKKFLASLGRLSLADVDNELARHKAEVERLLKLRALLADTNGAPRGENPTLPAATMRERIRSFLHGRKPSTAGEIAAGIGAERASVQAMLSKGKGLEFRQTPEGWSLK